MKSKTFLSFVVVVGMFAASPLWAVGGESGSGVHVSGGVTTAAVAGASGLIYGAQGAPAGRAAYGGGYAPAEAGQGRGAALERAVSDDADGSLAQILTGLALVLVLVGKRISG